MFLKHKVQRLTLFLTVSYALIANCSAADYYIDSVGGLDRNSGRSKSSPWKSHMKAESAKLSAGDVVHFKKGSAFSGNIEISESGTATKPIRLTSYGTGELPKFTNPTTRDASGNAILLRGDYIIVENLHFYDTPGEHVSGMLIMTRLAALRIDRGADHCIINPLFPALRSDPTTAPGAARQKQTPAMIAKSVTRWGFGTRSRDSSYFARTSSCPLAGRASPAMASSCQRPPDASSTVTSWWRRPSC